MAGFDPGNFLEETKGFDPDAFLADTDSDVFETGGPNQVDDFIGPPIDTEEMGRVRGTVAQRAENALRRWKAGSVLMPDDADALAQALGGDFGASEPVGALEAANLRGGNAALLGWGDELAGVIGGDDAKAAIRKRMANARAQHPAVSIASDIAGGIPTTMAMPNGWLGSAGVGAVAGAGNAEPGETATGALIGAGAGLAAKAAAEYGPTLARQIWQQGKIAAGKAFQLPEALRAMVAGEPRPTPSIGAEYAQPVSKGVEYAAEAATPAAAAPGASAPADDTGRLMMNELQRMAGEDQLDQAMRLTNSRAAENIPGAAAVQARHDPNVDIEGVREVLRRVRQLDTDQARAEAARVAQEPTLTQVGLEQLGNTANKRIGGAAANDVPVPLNMEDIAPVDGPDWAGAREAFPRMREAEAEFQAARTRQGWDADSRVAPSPLPEQPSVDQEALQQLTGRSETSPTTPGAEDLAAKRQRIIDAQKANPDALAAFGVDPNKNERGSIDMNLLEMLGGYGLAKMGARQAAKSVPAKAVGGAMAGVGKGLEDAGRQALSPDSVARSWTSNPQVLFHLTQASGPVGHAARTILQAVLEGDDATVKAQAALLGMQPEFREMFARGRADQDRQGRAASAQ